MFAAVNTAAACFLQESAKFVANRRSFLCIFQIIPVDTNHEEVCMYRLSSINVTAYADGCFPDKTAVSTQ